VKDKVAASG